MPSERSERVLISYILALRSKARGEEPEQFSSKVHEITKVPEIKKPTEGLAF
jgi:hypothetical protein